MIPWHNSIECNCFIRQPLELASRRTSDDTDVKITLDFKNEIQAGDPVYNSVSFLKKSNNFKIFADRQVTPNPNWVIIRS